MVLLTWFRQATWAQPTFLVEITSLPLQTGPVKTAPENVVATIVVFAAAFYAL